MRPGAWDVQRRVQREHTQTPPSETPLSDVLVCTACTSVQCQLGESVVACGASLDSSCVLCSSINGELPPNMQYVTSGVCDTVCVRGFFFYDAIQACVPCASHQCVLAGTVRSTDCVAMEDRVGAPTCVPCPPAPVGAEFRASCAWGCIIGYIPDAVRGEHRWRVGGMVRRSVHTY